MVVSLSADFTQTEMEEHPHPSFYQFTALEEDSMGPPADLTLTGSGRRSSPILPPMPTITTLVEGGHGLIGRPCLELHEVGFAATTFVIGTGGWKGR